MSNILYALDLTERQRRLLMAGLGSLIVSFAKDNVDPTLDGQFVSPAEVKELGALLVQAEAYDEDAEEPAAISALEDLGISPREQRILVAALGTYTAYVATGGPTTIEPRPTPAEALDIVAKLA